MKSNSFSSFIKKAVANITKGFKGLISYIKKAKVELGILVGVFLFDLITKFIIQVTMTPGQSIVVIPNLFNISYTINYYAAMGSFFGLENILGAEVVRIILLLVTFIACIGFFIAMKKFKGGHILARLSFSLIIGGALGNFYDRLFLSGVRDFLHIIYLGLNLPLVGSYFPIFNVADVSLTAGIIVFAVYFLFMYNPDKEKKEADSSKQSLLDADSSEQEEVVNNTIDSVDDNASKKDSTADWQKG